MKYVPTFTGPAILVVGGPDIGFRFYGPFVDARAAVKFIDFLQEHDTGFAMSDDATWVMPIKSEESVQQFYAEQDSDPSEDNT